MRRILLAVLLAIPTLSSAQGVVYDKSEIRFVSKQMGVEVEGRFRRWKANVDFRPGEAAQSRADFDVELASIDLASEESEAEVRKAEWSTRRGSPSRRSARPRCERAATTATRSPASSR